MKSGSVWPRVFVLCCAFGIVTCAANAPDISGQWQETDGACAGTRWTVAQRGEQVTSMQAQIVCANGHRDTWTASNIRWTSANSLSYTIRFGNGTTETHVTTFAGNTGTVEVFRGSDRVLAVRIARVSTTPSQPSAVPDVSGQWQETDGACAGTRWTVVQQGSQVTSMQAQIVCASGHRDAWTASGIRWTDANSLTYTIRFGNGTTETHVTTFAGDTGAVEVFRGSSRVLAVHLARIRASTPPGGGVTPASSGATVPRPAGAPGLDFRMSFVEIPAYTGSPTPPGVRAFVLSGPARYRLTVTYGPWYRNSGEMVKWRSTVPIDGRDFGAWVEFLPGAVIVSSRSEPERWVDGAGLVKVTEFTIRKNQPGMEVAIFPPVVRYGDGSFMQLKASASVVIEKLEN